MIQVSGMPFQQSDMWTAGSIERLIVQRMIEHTVVYSYQSIDELSFELKVRKNIIASARAMHKSNPLFETFANSRANPQYWQMTSNGGLLLKNGVKPSDAIQDIYLNSEQYAFECATAMVIIFYDAVLKSIGEWLFNQLFQNNIYLYSWQYDSELQIRPYYSYQSLPGDVIYFKNPEFDPQTPQWRGENAVELGDGTYFGHGLGIMTAEKIIDELNLRRKPESNQTAYLTNVIGRPSFTHLAKIFMSQPSYLVHRLHPIVHHNESSIPVDRMMI
ncbi:protein-glutamine gamma-glutamyltransferase [Paenisporosarcina quisquiliarum]|uniref:Protein-glutamine gamma-glutamyltransferase n=1 Tax=Paenisporosarcina quisquiliarum TaxID=365346 RepID=A0A9X3RE25_9BACL|nr:protein-glutamine gamma-glutamyltransferase [Paenisporosarcina quisquiliarum]MCZ8537734.1 protein-glutamine gamma-glutamyltransferase [Paenisporosarcina quisquiliarum]